jgi:hypothetical protein
MTTVFPNINLKTIVLVLIMQLGMNELHFIWGLSNTSSYFSNILKYIL